MENLDYRTYSDFINVKENYYPEINPNSIQSKNIQWDETFPHAAFVQFIKMTVSMLCRENYENHNILIEGAYGTGKSRLMWALQCILEAPIEKVQKYFQSYNSLSKETTLFSKIAALKSQKILTVSHYGSGDVNSTAKFIDVIFSDVSASCRKAKCEAKYGTTIRGKVIEWLSQDINAAHFDRILQQPQYQKNGHLAGKRTKEIIEELKKPTKLDSTKVDPTRQLLESVIKIGEENGLRAFKLDIDDVANWLQDVISENKLDGIVFFWDEFTSYIRQNSNSLDALQKLVEISTKTPFYLVLATHLSISFASPEQIKDKNSPFKALFDRFDHLTIDLPDSVAFDLIADSIITRKQTESDYSELLDSINNSVRQSRVAVSKFAQVADETLKRILPIHPYAALALKYIAKEFASNQRSMFSFMMNGNSEELETFEWFIKTYSPEDGVLLTIDRLWNFFYEKGSDSRAEGLIGRENLSSYIAQVLDAYPMAEDKIDSELSKRVFKCVLMLHAISRRVGNVIDILKPTLKNIEMAFEGDAELSQQIPSILTDLDEKGLVIVNKDEDDPLKNEYYATITTNDSNELDKIKKELRERITTEQLLAEGGIGAESFGFPAAINARFKFVRVTPSNFTKSANMLAESLCSTKDLVESLDYTKDPFHIGVIICFARDEIDQGDLRQRMAEIPNRESWHKLVFIDASAVTIGGRRFEDFINQSAYEELWRRKGDSMQTEDRKERKKRILHEWRDEILSNPLGFCYYGKDNGGKPTIEVTCNGTSSVTATLQQVVIDRYRSSFDHCMVSDNLFNAKTIVGGSQGAGAAVKPGIFQDKSVNNLIDPKLRETREYWKDPEFSKLPISRLKVIVDDFVQEELNKYGRVSFCDIFDKLVPEGFMPLCLYAYLLGFLLKEYAKNDLYHYGIGDAGESGDVMTPEKLGEYVNEALKHKHQEIKNYTVKYLEIMTRGQKAFMDFVKTVFGVDASSVELTASKMRSKLTELGPIWCFKRLEEAKMFTVHLDLIAQIASVPSGKNVLDLADQFGAKIDEDVVEALKMIFTASKAREGMRIFLTNYQSGVIFPLAKEIGLDQSEAIADAFGCVSSDKTAWAWLWEEDTGKKEIDSLILEYKIIRESYEPTKTQAGSFKKCLEAWVEFTRQLKAPYETIRKSNVEVGEFIGDLHKLAIDGKLPDARRSAFLKALEDNKEKIANLPKTIAETIKTSYKAYVPQFDEGDFNRLIAMLPKSSFTDDEVTYQQNLAEHAEKIRKEKKKHELLEMWQCLTNSSSPSEWSSMHKTPALALAPRDEFEKAKKLFATIHNPNATENAVLEAIAYLNTQPSVIVNLNDTEAVESAFREKIIGKYACVLKDNNEVRKYLFNSGHIEPFSWYGDSRVQDDVRDLAQKAYRTDGYEIIAKEIDSMTPEQAKEYLKELVRDDLEVGVSILRDHQKNAKGKK